MAQPNAWGDLPPATKKEVREPHGILEVIEENVRNITERINEELPSTDGFLSWIGLTRCNSACCSRAKDEPKEVFWETNNMSWWDFQKRRMQSIWLAKAIYDRTKKAIAGYEALEESGKISEAEEFWESTSEINAKEMREHAEYAKGLFIKATQQMSTMHGVLPDAYCEEFCKTTDHLPVSSPDEVYNVIEKDLERVPTTIFSAFDQAPVASASIGQVHKACLRENGELVAVKVQHDGVDQVFMEDLGTLAMIAEQVAYWHPGLDLRKAVDEWNEALPRELDFRDELNALVRAHRVLNAYGSPVLVPQVKAEISNRKVLVMEFVDAWPIANLADPKFCQAKQVCKTTVMKELLNAFGILTFRDGLIHGDPHGGNIRCLQDTRSPGGARPVIFDWGMTRVLSNDERFSLAKVFHSLANMDIPGIFDALYYLGFRLNGELLTDDLQQDIVSRLRGVMKDTVSKSQTRMQTRKSMKEMKDREKAGTSMTKEKYVQEWPKCIVFFLRMCECVRGLCVQCEAEGLPVLEIFTNHARRAFIEGSKQDDIIKSVSMFTGADDDAGKTDEPQPLRDRKPSFNNASAEFPRSSSFNKTELPRASPVLFPPEPAAQTAIDSALEKRVKACLATLVSTKGVVGAQIAVVQDDRILCDIPFGTLSTIDMRPVTSETRFPLLGAVSGVCTLALLRDLRRITPSQLGMASSSSSSTGLPTSEIALDTPIAQMWPEFGGGDSPITLRQLLGHTAGVQDAFPIDFGPQYLNSPAAVQNHFELLVMSDGSKAPRCAYILQTFLLAKLADCITPRGDIWKWLRGSLGPLGLELSPPTARCPHAVICRDLPSLSRVPLNEVETARSRRLEKNQADATDASQNGGASSSSSKFAAGRPSPTCITIAEACMKNPLTFDPLLANISAAADGRGRQFRAGLPVSVSARGLALTLSSRLLQDDLDALGALELQGRDESTLGWFLTGGAIQYTAGGLQIVDAAPTWPQAIYSRRQQGYGIVCGLGPCVIHFPGLAKGGVTIAVMVNDVLRGREVAAALVAEVLASYGYKPTWSGMPISVATEAARIVTQSSLAAPLLKQIASGETSALQQAAAMAERVNRCAHCITSAKLAACVCGGP